MKRVGKVGKRRAAALRKLMPLLIARAGNRCEVPWCRTAKKPIDPHHVVKRSQGGKDELSNLVHICRPHHDATDLPMNRVGHLEIRRLPAGFRFVMPLAAGERLCMDLV